MQAQARTSTPQPQQQGQQTTTFFAGIPIVGKNARERRRIRRQMERYLKQMEASIASAGIATPPQGPQFWYPNTPQTQAAATSAPRRPSHHGYSVSYDQNALLQQIQRPATTTFVAQQTPTVAHHRRANSISNSRTWSEASPFPSALSVPKVVSVPNRGSGRPSSAMLLGLNDPEVDHLSDLSSLMDDGYRRVSEDGEFYPTTGRNSMQSSTSSRRKGASSGFESPWSCPSPASSYGSASEMSLPPTPPHHFTPLPPSHLSQKPIMPAAQHIARRLW